MNMRELINLVEAETKYKSISTKKIIDIIKNDCAPWLEATKNGKYFVYRGKNIDGYDIDVDDNLIFYAKSRNNRYPKDSSEFLNNTLIAAIKKVGLIANRNNSFFVGGDSDTAENYGDLFVFIPKGDFHYTWSPKLEDAWSDLEDKGKNILNDFKEIADIDSIKEKILSEIEECKLHLKNKIEYFTKIQKIYGKTEETTRNLKQLKRQLKHYSSYVDDNVKIEIDKERIKYGIVNLDKFLKEYPFKGDDGSLLKAIKSKNEILIHAVGGYYIDAKLYKTMLNLGIFG